MTARKMLVPVAMLVLTGVTVGGRTAPQNPTAAPPATVVDRGAPGAGGLTGAQRISLRSYPGTKAWRITYRTTTSTGTPPR